MDRVEIDRQLRARIIKGQYPSGSRLPTRILLEKEFGVSPNTIQQALNRLVKDGFVIARGRQGTFVSEVLPHLSKIAIVFSGELDNLMESSHFYRSFVNEAEEVGKQNDVSFEIIDGVSSWRNSDKMDQLLDDIVESRLAGLIFPSAPFALEKTAIVNHPGIARAAIGSKSRNGIPSVWHDDRGFMVKAMEHLSREGCVHPVFLVHEGHVVESVQSIMECAELHDISVQPKDIQTFSLNHKEGIVHSLALLFDPEHPRKPDGLVIADDSIVELVTGQLAKMGFNGHDGDVSIVGLANFPTLPKKHLPMLSIGFEANLALETCVQLILAQLKGEKTSELTILPALYEHELGKPLEVQ
jgi:DNA-binding LacI/PurR family transcriptional regulator